LSDPELQGKGIVPVPVMPLVTPEKAAEQWKLFEALKAKLLTEEDYQSIAGKRYIKRSGFRKIAVYFGISDRIIKEERLDREDGSFSWRLEVEAYAPNGRSCIGVGACDSKERKFAHSEHDVFATAHTRAKSRAISDLVAGGAVSAEEVSPADLESSDETAATTAPAPSQPPTMPTPTKETPIPHVPIVKDTLVMEGLRQFPLCEGLKALGMLNVFEDETSIIPEHPLKIDGPTITNFLFPKILDPMVTKHNFSYTIAKTASGELDYILVIGRLSDQQIKELQTGSRWAFAKALEKEDEKQPAT
jgi:hypothetical protein